MSRAIEKYLAGYAEPESTTELALDGSYAAVLVVPACREHVSFLDGFADAASSAPGRVLCIVVVNGRDDALPAVHEENQRLLADVRDALGASRRHINQDPPMECGSYGAFDLLVVDRATRGHRFPSKQGVGLARKIGADIAVGLYRARKTGRWIHFADADATLPTGYFSPSSAAAPDVSALAFSFWHAPSGDAAVDAATALYEVSLRYYVLALAGANSPYAVHTLGSALAASVDAYAAARGVPKREAAEDFYLVNKLAKLGPVLRVDTHSVTLRSRASDRTPFGTGRAVDRLMAHSDGMLLYNPRSFEVVGAWLRELDAFSRHLSVDRLLSIAPWAGALSNAVRGVIEHAGGRAAIEHIARQSRSATDLQCRLHVWFDAFRTLKLVHATRDAEYAPVPWRDALVYMGFANESNCENLTELRHRLRCREGEQSRLAGPCVPRA